MDRYLISIREEQSRLASSTTRSYRITKSNAMTCGTVRATTCLLESRRTSGSREPHAVYYQTSASYINELVAYVLFTMKYVKEYYSASIHFYLYL